MLREMLAVVNGHGDQFQAELCDVREKMTLTKGFR